MNDCRVGAPSFPVRTAIAHEIARESPSRVNALTIDLRWLANELLAAGGARAPMLR